MINRKEYIQECIVDIRKFKKTTLGAFTGLSLDMAYCYFLIFNPIHLVLIYISIPYIISSLGYLFQLIANLLKLVVKKIEPIE